MQQAAGLDPVIQQFHIPTKPQQGDRDRTGCADHLSASVFLLCADIRGQDEVTGTGYPHPTARQPGSFPALAQRYSVRLISFPFFITRNS